MLAALTPGSFLVHHDGTYEVQVEALRQAQKDYDDTGADPYVLREPGQVSCLKRRPEPADLGPPPRR